VQTPGWSFLRSFGSEPYGRAGVPVASATIGTSGLLRGAAVVYGPGNTVIAPSGAAVTGFAGLLHEGVPAANTPGPGSTAGTDVSLKRTGIGKALLATGYQATRGQSMVIAGTDGSLRPYVNGTDIECDIVGTSEDTLSAGGTAPAPFRVNLDAFSRIA
jgi:hypothetical protein